MAGAISQEDFERLQSSLIDLRNTNYELIEKSKKQDAALFESLNRTKKLEEDLAKATNAIQKSKKISEVEKLGRENESLQRKLLSQEDEFRLQNQALLQELSKLVTANEHMENRIKNSQCMDANQNPDPDTVNANNANVEQENQKLHSEVARLKMNVLSLKEEKESLQIKVETLTSKVLDNDRMNNLTVEAISFSSDSVAFSKVGGSQGQTLSEEQFSTKSLKDILAKEVSEKERISSENKTLQTQIEQVQNQLKKKKESFLMLQNEKEDLFHSYRQQTEDAKVAYERETADLKDQVQRLQVQLKNGHSGFADFKGLKQAEIEALKQEIFDLKNAVENCPPEKLSDALVEINRLTSQLSDSNQLVDEMSKQKETLTSEVETLKVRFSNIETLKLEIENQFRGISEKYDSAKELSEKRKVLLDEMSVCMQNKKMETDEKIHDLQSEIQKLVENLTSQTEAFNGQQDELLSVGSKLKETEDDLNEKNTLIQKLNEEILNTKSEFEKKINNLIERHNDEVRFGESEWKLKLQDLSTQVEIANAQTTEFEDLVRNHQQELKDVSEERKIREKKNQGLIKDLKRQLVAEQQKNNKLSEKIKELLKDQVTLLDSDNQQSLEVDRTSNSSWSIYSENNEPSREPNTFSTPIHKLGSNSEIATGIAADHDLRAQRSRGQSSIDFTQEDYQTLLCKIAALQDEKINLQNQLQMLEQSSAAMADDLLKKSSLIQFYCMDSKAGSRASSQPQTSVSSPGFDKLKVKSVVEMLINQHSDSKEEVQRMQKMLEETLMKNMYLQKDMEHLSQEVVRLSKLAICTDS